MIYLNKIVSFYKCKFILIWCKFILILINITFAFENCKILF